MSDRSDSLRRMILQLRAELALRRAEYDRVLAMLERLGVRGESISDLPVLSSADLGADHVNHPAYTPGQGPPVSGSAHEVRRLEVLCLADGSARVRLDAGPPFRLPCGAVEFLLFLVSGPPAADGLPQWRSRRAIRTWLEELHCREVPAKLVNHRVHTLRKHLRAAGVKKDLVRTHPRLGVRFALLNPESGLLRQVLGGGDRR